MARLLGAEQPISPKAPSRNDLSRWERRGLTPLSQEQETAGAL
jgi:hypothetical protein